jgi:hypothetical protein
MFVVSLLETVQKTRDALNVMHDGIAKYRTREFKMPTVLVVMETNYAYGAAVYMQFMFFLDQRKSQIPGLKDVDIVFATPVYMWNIASSKNIGELKEATERLKRIREHHAMALDAFHSTWDTREKHIPPSLRHKGNKKTLLSEVHQQSKLILGEEFDKTIPNKEEVERMLSSVLVSFINSLKLDNQSVSTGDWIAFERYCETYLKPALLGERMSWYSLQVQQKQVSNLNNLIAELTQEGIKN